MRLPTLARSECTYPCRIANTSRWTSAAQHNNLLDDHHLFTKHANCSLQHASPRPTANRPRRRCPHSLYLCSHRSLRSPIRSFRSRYLGGATACQLGPSQGRGIFRALPGVPWAVHHDVWRRWLSSIETSEFFISPSRARLPLRSVAGFSARWGSL